MTRLAVLAVAWCAASGLGAAAEAPQKPAWQRVLDGADAEQAAKLERLINEREAKDDYAGAVRAGEELLALRARVQGEGHHETLNLRYNLAAYRKVAALPAEKQAAWRAALAGAVEAAGLEAGGRYAAALPLRKAALDRFREVLGEGHPITASGYANLAFNLDAQARHARAEPLHRKALAVYRKALGEDHPDTAASCTNLGLNLNGQGRYADAEPLLRKGLEVRRKALGEEHPDTAQGYANLAYNLNAQARYAEAEPLLRKGLAVCRKVLGEAHPDTAATYTNLGLNLNGQGRYAEAEPLLRQALDALRKSVGEAHPDTARGYNNLAFNLNAQAKHVAAEPLFRQALEILRKAVGEDHPDTALTRSNLAANLAAQGRYAEAEPLLRQALEAYRKAADPDHPSAAATYNNLAANLDAQGRHAEAEPLLRKALEIRRKALGERHPDTAQGYNNLAGNLDAQVRYADAEPLYRKALDIMRKALGSEHPGTAGTLNNLAANLDNQGRYAEAEPLYRRALEVRRKALGEGHPDTASSSNNLAYNLDARGRFAEAEPLYRRALEVRRKALGDSHPATAGSYSNVAYNLAAQGKHAEAEAEAERAVRCYESNRLVGAAGLGRAQLDHPDPRLLLAVLRRARDPEGAWRLAELSLARGLLDHQAAGRDPRLTAAERDERDGQRRRIDSLQPRILALAAQADRTKEESAQLEALLGERREAEGRLAAVAVRVSQREVADAGAIRAALPADAALLLWVDVSDGSGDVEERWACVVRQTGDPKWERLPGTGPGGKWSADDARLPGELRQALAGSAPQAEVLALAERLRAQRVAPALKHLEGVRAVYAVPVNHMAGVPVELLLPDRAVSYAPSGTFLARAKAQAPPAGTRALALGDPTFARPGDKPAAARPLPPGGVLVAQVLPGSAAANARLRGRDVPAPIQAGDVLLKYGDAEPKDLDTLKAAIAAHAEAKAVPVTVWRESEEKPLLRDVAPGRLGVVLDPDPAPAALAARRQTESALLALRGGGWKELPGTRVEAERLRRTFGDQCRVLTGSAASEQGLEALRKSGELSAYRYLHLATHGAGNAAVAFESALILAQDRLPKDPTPAAGGPAIDGRLTAAEVLEHWRLDAELVTLSACETAVGARGRGDGSLGFAQAFLSAGARAVCLSLWKVDDTATALLMDRFYRNLLGKRSGLEKPLGKSAALDEAKRWLRGLSGGEALALAAELGRGVARGKGEDLELAVPSADPKAPAARDSKPFAHPRYWAAFVLIGDPN